MLSAKLTEEEGAIKPFYIDLRDTRTFIPDKNIVRQPHLEEIIQSVLRFTFGGHLREFCGTRLMVFFKVSFIQARAYFVCLLCLR
jgi:hypothetical protein